MARAAFLPKTASVDIHLRVAIDALVRGLLEALRRVALAAGHGNVQAKEREGAHVVIESHVLPVGLRMALLALLAETASVRLIGPMAAGAVGRELLCLRHAGMTGVAIELRVRSFQRKVEPGCVIEARCFPGVVAVAVGALGPEPPHVPIVGFVAAVAVLRDGILEVAGAMAFLAADACVTSEQGEAGLPRVIELLRRPVSRRVAVAALRPLAAPVDIVRHVAADARLRRALVALTRMAGCAGGLTMLVREGELRLVVVEVSLSPFFCVMA